MYKEKVSEGVYDIFFVVQESNCKLKMKHLKLKTPWVDEQTP